MKRSAVVALVLFLAVFVGATSSVFAIDSLVRFEGVNRAQIVAMANKGVDIARVGSDFVEIVVNQTELKKVARQHPKYNVLIADLDKYIAGIMSAQRAPAAPQYFTYDTMVQTLKGYVSSHPTLCKLESIGKSCEGRDIWALKISKNVNADEKEPRVLIMGAHHSREWISFEVPMATLKALVEGYGADERLTRLVDSREIWFVPMVNPDGVTYSQTKERYWRKNRRKNSDGSFGVDPNRNYGYQWGGAGTSNSPGADTYRGPSAFSEPETQAIRDFATKMRFSADITFHSYSELILYPWSYAEGVANPDKEVFAKFAGEMAAFNKYTPQESCDLYPSSGDTDDFMYGQLKSLSFTFELARTFIPQPSEIANICAANVPAVLHLIDKAGTYGLVTPQGAANIMNLDTPTAVAALTDLAPFAKAHDAAAASIEAVQTILAQRVLAEEAAGTSTTLNLIKQAGASDAVAGALKLIGQGRKFEQVHTNSMH